jgi:hypothetical protein
MQKVYFSHLIRDYVGVYLVQGSFAFNWSAGLGTFLQVLALASHWLKDCAKFSSTPE